jgi:hypothetical protein
MTAQRSKRWLWAVLAMAACANVALASSAPPQTAHAATGPVTSLPQELLVSLGFWPNLEWPTLCWFAAVVLLALTIHLRPLTTLRNLDSLVLAGTCLLLGLRDTAGSPPRGAYTWHAWAYAGLTVVAIYWLVRGIGLLLSTRAGLHADLASSGTRLVLLIVALVLCIQRIATAPLSAGSRDGIVGGLCTAASGKLPYGDAPEFASRSPLMYLLHAGAVRAIPPTLRPADEGVGRPMTWENRAWWLAEPWTTTADLTAARLVNAVLFILLLIGLGVIGTRWQTPGSAWTVLAIFCIFPGTLECLAHPDLMLPAVLFTWTLALALLPGIGGLLATLCLVLAGVAWPWAWLGLPVLLAHFWRRGWQALGSTVGLLAGAAACVFGLGWLVRPALPRADGALALAGLRPSYTARLADHDTLVIDRRSAATQESAVSPLTGQLWRFLVESESAPLKSAGQGAGALKVNWPNGTDEGTVLYRDVYVAPAALPVLQPPYRDAVAQMPDGTRLLVAARTVLEATWMPAHAEPPAVVGAWQLWGGPAPMSSRWVLIRRIVKAVVLVLVLWTALAVFVGRRVQPRHLLATLLIIASGTLLASTSGAATNWVWLLPLVTALWAVHEPVLPAPARPAPPRSMPPPPPPIEAPPRITIETRPAATPP